MRSIDYPVRYLAFSPEERDVLAVAGEDRTLQTIDIKTGKIITKFDTEKFQIAFDSFAVAGSGDDGVGSLVPNGDGISFSADGRFLMSELRQGNKPKVYDPQRSPEYYDLYKKPLYGIWDTSTGKFLGKYSDIIFLENGSVLDNGSRCNYFKDPESNEYLQLRYAISSQSKKLAMTKEDGYPHIYDLDNGTLRFSRKLTTGIENDTNWGISFSPDGSLLAVIRKVSFDCSIIEIWNVYSGKKISEIKDRSRLIHSVKFSPNNQQLLYCGAYYSWNQCPYYRINVKDIVEKEAVEKEASEYLDEN